MFTTRFHSFTDGNIPSVCDRTFVGKVFTDYITSGKMGESAPKLRLFLQTLMIIAILVFLFWGIMIFWGNGFGVVAV